MQEAKKGTFSVLTKSKRVLGISTSADVDEGLCPLNPCQLLKKLDQNFFTCDSSVFVRLKVHDRHMLQSVKNSSSGSADLFPIFPNAYDRK